MAQRLRFGEREIAGAMSGDKDLGLRPGLVR
jgi:hypothetical protein